MSHRLRPRLGGGLAVLLLAAGCGGEPPETAYQDRELGIGFDFPEGWQRLPASQLPRGKESLVTIEDSARVASVSLVEFDLPAVLRTLDVQLMLQMVGEGKARRALALFTQLNSTFEDVFAERYAEFELLDREWVRVLPGGKAVASELVFKGKLSGEPMMWRKAAIILIVGQEEKGFIMAYSSPLVLLEDFLPAFQSIEASWRTIP